MGDNSPDAASDHPEESFHIWSFTGRVIPWSAHWCSVFGLDDSDWLEVDYHNLNLLATCWILCLPRVWYIFYRYSFAGGRVLTWGRGTSGRLGHVEMVNCLHPKYVESLEGVFITHASAGWNHSGFVSGFFLSASSVNLIWDWIIILHTVRFLLLEYFTSSYSSVTLI